MGGGGGGRVGGGGGGGKHLVHVDIGTDIDR